MVAIARNNRVGAAIVECVFAVEVEVVKLIEAGAADVHAELKSVVTLHPSQAIGPLKTIPHLRQEALEIIAKLSATRNIDERNAGEVGGKSWGDAVGGTGSKLALDRVRPTARVRHAGETKSSGGPRAR